MASVGISPADVQLLVARSTWPVPAIKWWAIQQLAILLIQSSSRDVAEFELFQALASCKLETEVIELLFVFWLAKNSGYVPNASLPTYVNAKSPASSLVLGELLSPLLHAGKVRVPLVVAPQEFKPEADFHEAQGTTVPKIFLTLLRNLEDARLPSFVKQFAFEWANTKDLYPDAPLQHDIRYFFDSPMEEMTGQFVTRASHRGRSAYLRTLAIAQEICGAPQGLVEEHAMVALPLDPTLAALRPKRPSWIPPWKPEFEPRPDSIDQFIRTTAQRLRDVVPGMLPLAYSFPLRVSEREVLELEVVAWVQWEEKPIDAHEITVRFEKRAREKKGLGWCKADRFSTTTECPINTLDEILDKDACAVPTVADFGMWRRGYLHSDLYSRGILLPMSTVKSSPVHLKPSDDQLLVEIEKAAFGYWQYWNTAWDPCHPRSTRAFCGTALIASVETLPRLWQRKPFKHFHIWRCTRSRREQTYSKYSSEVTYGAVT